MNICKAMPVHGKDYIRVIVFFVYAIKIYRCVRQHEA